MGRTAPRRVPIFPRMLSASEDDKCFHLSKQDLPVARIVTVRRTQSASSASRQSCKGQMTLNSRLRKPLIIAGKSRRLRNLEPRRPPSKSNLDSLVLRSILLPLFLSLRGRRRRIVSRRSRAVGAGQPVVQEHIQKRLVHTDAATIFNEAELAEAIHEETYA